MTDSPLRGPSASRGRIATGPGRTPPPLPVTTGPDDPTWREIKQLGWFLLLLYPFIAIGAFSGRSLVGGRVAFWTGVGLAAFITTCFALIVLASLAASVCYDLVQRRRRRRRSLQECVSRRDG